MDNEAIDWSSFLELEDLPDWLTPSEETSADAIFESDQSQIDETMTHGGLLTQDNLHGQQVPNPTSSIGWSQFTKSTRAAWHYNDDSGALYDVFAQPETALSLQLPPQAREIDVDTRLDLGSALSLGKDCECIVCLGLGGRVRSMVGNHVCRVRGCHQAFTCTTESMKDARLFHDHETGHFRGPGGYICAEKNCHAVITDFSDLKRHYNSKHCTNRTRYPCSVTGCKYSGENGFARKDKLKSHFKNMHAGNFPATTNAVPSDGHLHGAGNAAAAESHN